MLSTTKLKIRTDRKIKEVPFPMVFSMVLMSTAVHLSACLAFPGIRDAVLTPAINILTDPLKYSSTIIGL